MELLTPPFISDNARNYSHMLTRVMQCESIKILLIIMAQLVNVYRGCLLVFVNYYTSWHQSVYLLSNFEHFFVIDSKYCSLNHFYILKNVNS